MPMLAEPKKKSKLTLNPRGTLWANDENKFGKKLLEKMGWSNGKGLGRDEQGMKNPIHVSGNSENKGIGFKGNPELTTQHYQDFEDVLSSLNSESNSESSNNEPEKNSNSLKDVESLEMKSKNSRARVHYSKFTRGKDLSRYNEDDLACVLGSKKSLKNKEKNESENVENTKENGNEEAEEKADKAEHFTYYSGNLKDYFNQKMEELKRKRGEGLLGDKQTPRRAKMGSNSTPGTPFPDLEFEPEKNNFSFNLSVQDSDVSPEYSSGNVDCPEEEKEKTNLLNEEETEEVINKKKKRKKSKKNKDLEKVESNPEEEKDSPSEINVENNVHEIKIQKKKKRGKSNRDDAEEGHSSDNESKKKKRKRSKEEKEVAPSCKSEEPPTNNDSGLNVEDEIQPYNRNMNESYVKATSTGEKKKNKKREACEETSEERENGSSSRPLKKLRKLASEISLPEILKSSSEKIENENNANCEVENQAVVDKKIEEEKSNSKVKLKSKKSFKERKADFETRVKEKFKKISKTELVPIEEEENETKISGANNSKILHLNIPVGYENGEYINSAPKQYRTVEFDVEKTFPNSNLEKIKGYFKS